MRQRHICGVCAVCGFKKPDRCSAYRLAASIYENKKFQQFPDMEAYLNYLQSGLADELALALEDFLADIRARLSKKQFRILMSHVYYGRSLKVVARNEGITIEGARQRLNIAIAKVKSEWGENSVRKSLLRRGRREKTWTQVEA